MRYYTRLNQKAIFDPFRKIFIQENPEEIIRQKVAEALVEKMVVPAEFIRTEFPLAHIDSSCKKRVDILVCFVDEDEMYGLLVIEVKSEKVPLNDRTIKQVLEYQEILGCAYIGITNSASIENLILYQVNDDGSIIELEDNPNYLELLNRVNIKYVKPVQVLKRISYEEINSKQYLENLYYDIGVIGQDTPRAIWPFLAELHNFIEAEGIDSQLPIKYGPINVNEDIGSNLLNFGNASGAIFSTYYRGFIIKDSDGNDQICRIAINSVAHTENHPVYGNRKGTTVLNVAVDNFDKACDHVLELCLDKWLYKNENRFELWHDGRMSGIRNYVVIQYIKENAPILLVGDRIYFGSLPSQGSITWDHSRMLMGKIILYAILRKKLRELKRTGNLPAYEM